MDSAAGCAPLIRIEHADVYQQRTKVLHQISWQMRRDEHWAILGPNGAGKTTFLQLISGELQPAVGGRIQRFELTDRDTVWDLKRRIGQVSPDLQANYRETITGAQLVVSGFFSSRGLVDRPTRRQRSRAQALFEIFGLANLRRRNIQRLSYGELRKLLTLRALVHNPRVLILDEPFDGLDAAAKADFAEALERVAANGTGLITVTHHLDDLPRCMTHALLLKAGRVVRQGPLWWGAESPPGRFVLSENAVQAAPTQEAGRS